MVKDREDKRQELKSPRSTGEKLAGAVAGIFTFSGVFVLVLRIIDSISRVQTLATLEPYIHYLLTWWGQLIELGTAVFLVVCATRIEQAREKADAPRIILPYSRQPDPIERHRLWIKLAAGCIIVAFLCAGSTALILSRHSTKNHDGEVSVTSNLVRTTPAVPPENTPAPGKPKSQKHADKKARSSTHTTALPTGQVVSIAEKEGAAPTPQTSTNQPLHCPPKGTIFPDWFFALGHDSDRSNFNYLISLEISWSGKNPFEGSGIDPGIVSSYLPKAEATPLSGQDLQDGRDLISRIISRISAQQPIRTSEGDLPVVRDIRLVGRSVQADKIHVDVRVYSKAGTGGIPIGSQRLDIDVKQLPPQEQKTISKFDVQASAKADQWCQAALQRISGK
jgi:hypothetical protein